MKVEIDLQGPPVGYEYTGEYRAPKVGEPYINPFNAGLVSKASSDHPYPRFILREVTKWRDATVEDAIRAIRGEKVVARMRDAIDDEWKMGERLIGYISGAEHPWVCGIHFGADSRYKYCQVQE